jgi:hypothetical protein
MLLLDRFLSADGSTLDLATGVGVRTRVYARPTTTPLYATRGSWRLVDAGPRSPRTFVEVWSRADDVPPGETPSVDGIRAALQAARD